MVMGDCYKRKQHEGKRTALTGQEDETVTFGRYGKDFQPTVMLEVVEALSAEITSPIPSL